MADSLLDLSKFTDEDFKLLDEKVRSAMEYYGIPGVALGIGYGDKEYLAGYGVTNVENPLPVTPDTLFQIGSTTKTMTTTALMRLVEMGKVDLDAPLRRYLPDLTLKDAEAAEKVTVKNVITHTAGWVGDFFADTGMGDDALEKFVQKLAGVEQVTPPGKFWSYNNAAFSVAGRVIEVVTGKPYETSLKELLLTPLGMENSFFFANEVISYRVASGHRRGENGPEVNRKWELPRSSNPAGGICTTVKDQLKYARFHMGDGKASDGTQLLSPETLALMKTPVVPAGSDENMGLSWFSGKVGNVLRVRHGGGTFGQLSAFEMVPDRQFAFALVTNSDVSTGVSGQLYEDVTDWVFEHFLGAKNAPAEVQPIPADALPEYVGNYNALISSINMAISESGELEGEFVYHTNGLFEVDPPPIPGVKFGFLGKDVVLTQSGPFKDVKGQFIRNEEGKIGWFRFGGRMAVRRNS
ncbi:MAG: beta-lactamase family protein [Chloroflexi bacterium]|nr:beta-lactamase family protein [Chloroflexota bacterium]OJV95891.1 MAG: hypothetical protein BGO39_21530 [Chloroflexi bacterium 54-19]